MGIQVVGLDNVKTLLEKAKERAHQEVLAALDRTGQRLVETALATKQYKDRTGNLTASIGYGVYSNGAEISVGGFGGGDGEMQGRLYLAEIAALYSTYKYALIVVAGMDYAVAVERKGFVVLDGALVQADSALRAELNSINIKLT